MTNDVSASLCRTPLDGILLVLETEWLTTEDEDEHDDDERQVSSCITPKLHYSIPKPMGSIKKRRKAKINKHKRRKKLRANRHKKRTWQK